MSFIRVLSRKISPTSRTTWVSRLAMWENASKMPKVVRGVEQAETRAGRRLAGHLLVTIHDFPHDVHDFAYRFAPLRSPASAELAEARELTFFKGLIK